MTTKDEFEQWIGRVVAAYVDITITVLAVIEALDGRPEYARKLIVGASDKQKFDALLRLAESNTDLNEAELKGLRKALGDAEEARNTVVHSSYVYDEAKGADTEAPDSRIKERTKFKAGQDPFVVEPVTEKWFKEKFEVIHRGRVAIGIFATKTAGVKTGKGDLA